MIRPSAKDRISDDDSLVADQVYRPAVVAPRSPRWWLWTIGLLLFHLVVQAQTLSGGRQLAEKYCTACHLLPEPAQLTRLAWAHQIQPEMAKWLGFERVDFEGMPDGKLLEEAGLFPGSPILSEDDWFAIWDYYRQSAPSQPRPQLAKPAAQIGLPGFRVHVINPSSGVPTISLTRIAPGGRGILMGDAFSGGLYTLNKAGAVLGRERFVSAPVSICEGQRRSYVTLIGHLFPSDQPDGALVTLPDNFGNPRPILEHLRRPTDAVALDLNQDGREDFAVCQFGHRLGQFSWFENKGENRFVEHVLLDRPGAIAVRALDFNQDGRTDLLVLMGQAREGLYLFINEGNGNFSQRALIEKPPTWGYAGFDLADFNRDGRVDVVTCNGDNGDFALPLKADHGVRIYRNDGSNQLTEVFFYPMHGAYKAIARDFDGDGDLDVAAIAFYPDFQTDPTGGFVYLENQGNWKFVPRVLPEAARGRWMTMDAGDVDGDGDDDIVLSSFVKGPTTVPVPVSLRETWRTNGAAVLLLENLRR